MTPGPNKILRIPTSGVMVKISTIASGNNCGMRIWTDGKMELPMLPDSPWLRRHPTNGDLFWTDDCEEIGEEEPWRPKDTAFADVPFAEEPTLDDYRRALATGVATSPEKEKYIRIRFWWDANNPVRRNECSGPQEKDFNDNLIKLSALLDTAHTHERFMLLEAHRELRDFAMVNQCLRDFRFPANYEEAIILIKRLVEEEDFTVREVGRIPERDQAGA
jgi:hypothetical protein